MYGWIVEYKSAHNGNSPDLRESKAGCDISSTSRVWAYLRLLERMGLIRIRARRARSLEIIGARWVPPKPG